MGPAEVLPLGGLACRLFHHSFARRADKGRSSEFGSRR